MTQATPEQPGTSYLDYRPARCRCGSMVRPYEVACAQCGRKQNLLFLGLEKIQSDNLDWQIADLDKQIARNPHDYLLLFRLAGSHLLRGRFDVARDTYRRVLKMKPDFTPARLNLGVTLACLGDADAAAQELRQFVRQEPHSSKAERAIRTICSIKNIPYEDALIETGLESGPKGLEIRRPETRLPSRGPSGRRYDQVVLPGKSRVRVSRTWLVFDLTLLFLIIIALLGWYGFPSESKTLLASAKLLLEKPFQFQVINGKIETAGKPAQDENDQTLSTTEPEADQGPPPGAVVNAVPTTTSFFPLKEGNTWTFSAFDTRDMSGQDVIRTSGNKTMTVLRMVNPKREIWSVRNGTDTNYYVEEPNGLFSLENPDSPWGDLIAQVPYPAEVGKSVTLRGQTVTVEAEEDVEVPAGKFHCVRLKYTVKEPGDMEWYAWYAQGIGLIRYRGGGREGSYHFLVLGKYTLK
jgi:hypothetical protein